MNRTLLAGLVGGLIIFAWGYLSHTVLPIGHMGLSHPNNEAEVIAFLKTSLPEPGTYAFPDLEAVPPDQWPATSPSAVLAWHPDRSMNFGKFLGVEFASNVLAALVAALLVGCGMCGSTFLCRATAVMGMGVFAWLSISASQWNWYGFSNGVFIGEGLDQAIGWFLAGLGIAALTGKKDAAAPAA